MATYLFNAPIIDPAATPLKITITEVDVPAVRALLAAGFESAIGHEASADFLSLLLGMEVPTKRQAVQIRPGDTVVALKLQGRLPEGKVLTAEEMAAVPFKLLRFDAE